MTYSKKLERIEKIIGKERMEEIDAQDDEVLRITISSAAGSIKEAEEELESNPKYQDLKETIKALSSGLRELKTRQKAIIFYALHALEEKSKDSDRRY